MEQALYYADTPTADAQDLSAYYSQLYELYATDVLRMCYFYLADRQKAPMTARSSAHFSAARRISSFHSTQYAA